MIKSFSSIFFILFILSSSAYGNPIDPRDIIQISNKTTCASGFLLEDGTLVTSYHVAEKICPTGLCKDITLARSKKSGEIASETIQDISLEIKTIYPVLDIALLGTGNLSLKGSIKLPNAKPDSPLSLSAVGFPSCGELTETFGDLTEVEDLFLITNLQLQKGSSGSPVFDQNGNLVGVVSQADSYLSASFSFFTKISISAKLSRADLASEQTDFAQALQSYYQNSVSNTNGFTRLAKAIQFYSLYEKLKTPISFEKNEKIAALGSLADREMLGIKDNEDTNPFPGIITFSAVMLVILVTIIILWAFSLGILFSRTKGNIFWRMFVLALLALSWPVSLFALLIKQKK